MNIIRKWYSNAQFLTHQTSGSTGRPKKVNISREKIEISTRATMAYIDPEKSIKSSLLCLNPFHIGGAMVIYRSLICNHDLTIVEPSSDISEVLKKNHFDLVSLVPIQFNALTKSQLDQFGTILIGGAPIGVIDTESKSNIYSTYGMTETVSHIALRKINEEFFSTTGDTEVAYSRNNLLKIKGAITDNNWLTTNDVVEIQSNKLFKWLGRQDFMINTGGIKVNPEDIERQLNLVLEDEFIIGSLPDKQLGSKIVLISSGEEKTIDYSHLEKYHRPKANYFGQIIFRTESGKIDRRKTQLNFERNL
ncbi:AMP-binding protein [Ekhidna sp. To15]|uniref:AMP-binding protein n=1 Tax=Ekhidna sp. To15 TaxID=3395267 RepID=UPI003F52082D